MDQERIPQPAESVFANALGFLNAGLQILFADGVTHRDAKVAAVSIQTARLSFY